MPGQRQAAAAGARTDVDDGSGRRRGELGGPRSDLVQIATEHLGIQVEEVRKRGPVMIVVLFVVMARMICHASRLASMCVISIQFCL